MKLGIISLLSYDNTNYGNRLQAYALNHYINNNFSNITAESIVLGNIFLEENKYKISFILKRIHRIPHKIKSLFESNKLLRNRIEACNEFTIKNTVLNPKILLMKDLKSSDYDGFIVGSDIVWGQYDGGIDKARFLDFKTGKMFRRFSYAASFGRDWIPSANINRIRECLSKFEMISVREASSVKMLKDLSVNNVVHTMDPTLLLNSEHWGNIEKSIGCPIKNYIFVYLLGKRATDRECIIKFAKKHSMIIVTVPYACGEYNKVDEGFGDIRIMDCSPEEWIYLIHHADYVITDSFHGTVFSTIFKKKFIVLERQYTENINNRMIDYLDTINQKDKIIASENLSKVVTYEWDYDEIYRILSEKIAFSKDYINILIKSVM